MGTSFLQDEQNIFHPVYIQHSIIVLNQQTNDTFIEFSVHRLSNENMIGWAQVAHMTDLEFSLEWIENFSSQQGGKLKKIAVLLNQVIHQYLLSEIGKNYKLTLGAIRGAASYHYRSGFLTNDEKTDAYLNRCMSGQVLDKEVHGKMILSIEGRRFWQQEVLKHSINF